ncbi:MAG: ferritin-like domain-containing protein [Ferruginibacter sp.]|nr:ferritin-like domain-containing protein [Cytophagales bacterium]
MSKIRIPHEPNHPLAEGLNQPMKRGTFLKFAGATFATSTMLLAGCKEYEDLFNPKIKELVVDLGSGDIGILNYAYVLEQLEAAYYIQVMTTPYPGMSAEEKSILTDLRDHEIIHRDFFKKALGDKAIPALRFDFSKINFYDRTSVLTQAAYFEDDGVAAYNGAGKLIRNVDYLVLAGKIVSVEARHASAIRDLLNPLSPDFAGDDVVSSPNGLDLARTPLQTLPRVAAFIAAKINADNLPK